MALTGMATCHELMGRFDRAYQLYARIIDEYGIELPETRRARVTQHMVECDAHLGRLDVRAQPPGAHISIDGQDVTQLPVRLAAGPHQLVISAPGYRVLSRRLTVRAGARDRLDLVLEPLPRGEKSRVRPWVGRGLLIASGAMLVTGGGLLLLAERDFDDFDDLVAERTREGEPPGNVPRDLLDSGESKRDAGQIVLGVGIAAGVGAAVLLLWPDDPDAPRPIVDARTGNLGLGLSWSY
jgi:hypothetical protein